MNIAKIAKAAGVLVLSVALGGCAIASSVRLGPQSHFVHPNSNVTALGPVKAKANGQLGLVPQGMRTSDMDHILYQKALRQYQDADMIIDYVMTSRIIIIPLMYINLYMTMYELEGTAAKAEIGQQDLN